MTSSNFKNNVLIEQVRCLEEAAALPESVTASTSKSNTHRGQDFQAQLLQRAKTIIRQGQLQQSIDKPARLHTWAMSAAKIITALLGVFAVSNALSLHATVHNSINIYWLLLVLLGFNILSMALWLIGGLTGLGGLIGGSISQLPLSALQALPGSRTPAASAWFSSYYQGALGLWRLSTMSHLFWLIYLLSGLITLVVFFSAQQFDFYWGSTLLSFERFAQLTNWLSKPLIALGFTAPSLELLNAKLISNNVAMSEAAPEIRRHWALFLIAALILYGIVPRLVCWLISRVFLLRHERQFTPDFYRPYYIHLRQTIMPSASTSTIIDPDHSYATNPGNNPVQTIADWAQHTNWPSDCLFIGIELRPPLDQLVTINILNKPNLIQAKQLLESKQQQPLTLLVDNNNLPDRGVQRQIKVLFAQRKTTDRWLLLLSDTDDTNTQTSKNEAQQRLNDWYHCAQQAGVPAAQVQLVHAKQFDRPLAASTIATGKVKHEQP